MSQYLQFRSWLRGSSSAEKWLAAVSVVIVVGLISWALVPAGGPGGGSVAVGGGELGSPLNGTSGATPVAGGPVGSGAQASSSVGSTGATGSSSGQAAATGSSGGGGATGSSGGGGAGTAGGASPSQTGGAASGTTSAGCGRLTNSDTGVSSSQIKVADILLNLAGAIGNSAVGQASPQVQQQMAQAVVDDINSHGGVDCRKLAVTYYQANPIDPTSTQNICLQIQQAGVFAVIGGFAYPEAANDCLAQARIPVIANIAPTPDEARQYYPYLISPAPDEETDYADAIFGMKQRGWFTAAQGFKKLALLEDDCSPEINSYAYNDLIQAGVQAGQIVKNSFSCPSGGFASPSDMANFATQDRLANVTNIVEVTGGGSFKEFTTAAQSQGYKPKYLVSDYDGFLVTATSNTGPDPSNFDGTIVTTDTRFGETSTPGLTDPGTQACIALFARHGLPSSYITGSYLGATACNLFGFFQTAADHDAGPTRAGLAAGLAQVGLFTTAFPLQSAIYRAPGKTTPVKISGGDYWWTVEFYASCTCFKVIDPTEHPSFP